MRTESVNIFQMEGLVSIAGSSCFEKPLLMSQSNFVVVQFAVSLLFKTFSSILNNNRLMNTEISVKVKDILPQKPTSDLI